MQAITIPLEKAGVSFAPGVAEQIVERTDCYPYFIQVWGNYIAERLDQTGARVISMDTVKEVEAEAIKECNMMFQDRRNEIRDMGLLPVAESVAHAFIQSSEPHLHGSAHWRKRLKEEWQAMNRSPMNGSSGHSFSFPIWVISGRSLTPRGWYGYEPGIPSLMSYVHGYSLSLNHRETGDLSYQEGNPILPGPQRFPANSHYEL